jgi:hypothetical protein
MSPYGSAYQDQAAPHLSDWPRRGQRDAGRLPATVVPIAWSQVGDFVGQVLPAPGVDLSS